MLTSPLAHHLSLPRNTKLNNCLKHHCCVTCEHPAVSAVTESLAVVFRSGENHYQYTAYEVENSFYGRLRVKANRNHLLHC